MKREYKVVICSAELAESPKGAVEALVDSIDRDEPQSIAVRCPGSMDAVSVTYAKPPNLMRDRLADQGEVDERTIYAGDVFYVPFVAADGRVGYRICDHLGHEEFIYLKPAAETGDRKVFVHYGDENDTELDPVTHYYYIADWPREPGK